MTHWHWLGLGDQWPVPFPGSKRAFRLRIVDGLVTAKIHDHDESETLDVVDTRDTRCHVYG